MIRNGLLATLIQSTRFWLTQSTESKHIKTHQSPMFHEISTNLTRHLSPFAMALCMPRPELRLLALRLLALHFARTLIRWFVSWDSHPKIPTSHCWFLGSSKEPLHFRPISAGGVLPQNLTLHDSCFWEIWLKFESSSVSETLLLWMPQSLRRALNHQVGFLDVCLRQVTSFEATWTEVLFFRLWEGNDLVQCGRQYPFVPSKCICGGTLPYICWISESCLTSRLWRLGLRLWDFKGALLWSCRQVITSSPFMVCAQNPSFPRLQCILFGPGNESTNDWTNVSWTERHQSVSPMFPMMVPSQMRNLTPWTTSMA